MPRGRSPQQAVMLQHAMLDSAAEDSQDDDLALAKVLQEQEQMFLRLRSNLQNRTTPRLGYVPPEAYTAAGPHALDTVSTSSTERIGASMANRFQALQSSTASGSLASDGDIAVSPSEGGSDHDADMEFARKLQEEEDRIHYERMLQMAGIGTDPVLACLLLLSFPKAAIIFQRHRPPSHSIAACICLDGINSYYL
ncbi:hypothetical protein ABBQ32_006234 [Trebouxia sp. C0010 RCD-2024]